MPLAPTQAIITVTGKSLNRAVEELRQALLPYADAHIVAVTQRTNWFTSFVGLIEIVAVIDYTPAPPAN